MKPFVLISLLITSLASAQDTISYQWPVTPFNTQQTITGTFCEFRNTLTANHFHNGTDVPKADGSPVYPMLNGSITAISPSSVSGTSAYVRVEGTVNGVFKSIAYVHIEPIPTLTVGQSVTTGVTILGNILSGMGHTHIVDGRFDSENNALRKVGGLEPYNDIWSPKVISVKFYQDNSDVQFTNNKVYGLFDIVAQMVEVNAAATPNSGSTSNNGVYQTGYKIYSANRESVAYNPGVNGVRYKFDWKPNDDNANVVYTLTSTTSEHIYYLTNGIGNIGTSKLQSVGNSAFSSALLPAGPYQAMVYARDTHGNADTVFVPFEISSQDVVAPSAPVLRAVLNDSTNRLTVSWYPNTEPDLKGYRLYSSVNGTTWTLQKNESVLGPKTTKYSFTGISSASPAYFRMTAVDSAAITNESGTSDTYALRPNLAGGKVLIIDAFDRIGGSYKKLSHVFAMTAGQSLNARYETAHNNAVVDGSVPLAGYSAVVWMFGDESSTDETFGAAEQAKAIAYLNGGGKIFVNGSEVAYDLDRASGPSTTDRDFIHNYLHAAYAGDDANIYTINGTASTFMSGVSFTYGDTLQGSPYAEDYPDYLNPISGASTIVAAYTGGAGAMIAGSNTVVMGIPLETIHSKANRDAVMTKVLNYFGIVTSVIERDEHSIPSQFILEQNYPNPFNPSTAIRFSVTEKGPVQLKIYDVLGKETAVLLDQELSAGTYSFQWNAKGSASGVYFCRLSAAGKSDTKKLILSK
ncbi:MAG: T9SS type A sorting domain-containing protein [Bacteroidota bacterium]